MGDGHIHPHRNSGRLALVVRRADEIRKGVGIGLGTGGAAERAGARDMDVVAWFGVHGESGRNEVVGEPDKRTVRTPNRADVRECAHECAESRCRLPVLLPGRRFVEGSDQRRLTLDFDEERRPLIRDQTGDLAQRVAHRAALGGLAELGEAGILRIGVFGGTLRVRALDERLVRRLTSDRGSTVGGWRIVVSWGRDAEVAFLRPPKTRIMVFLDDDVPVSQRQVELLCRAGR